MKKGAGGENKAKRRKRGKIDKRSIVRLRNNGRD
jgi:hypothetical protein